MPDRNNPPEPMVFESASPYSLDQKASEEFHENISATVQDENTEKPPSSKSGIDISNVNEVKNGIAELLPISQSLLVSSQPPGLHRLTPRIGVLQFHARRHSPQ